MKKMIKKKLKKFLKEMKKVKKKFYQKKIMKNQNQILEIKIVLKKMKGLKNSN